MSSFCVPETPGASDWLEDGCVSQFVEAMTCSLHRAQWFGLTLTGSTSLDVRVHTPHSAARITMLHRGQQQRDSFCPR
ncbi:hypothetical protein GCM10023238_38350 [Streptomyces heliomycini]